MSVFSTCMVTCHSSPANLFTDIKQKGGFCPQSLAQSYLTLGVSCVIGVSFVIDKETPEITPEFMLMSELAWRNLATFRMGLVI